MEKANILIVEDESIIALEIERSLVNLGYNVIAAVNSSTRALEAVREHQIDLILMDIRIKGEKDGIETAEVIRKEFDIPVIFITAYLDKERIERAKLTMPFGYILKPVHDRDLAVTIEMALYTAEMDKKRREAEKKLRKNEEQLNTIYNSTSNYMCLIEVGKNDQYRLVSFNNAYEQGLILINPNLTKNDLIGRTIYEIAQIQNWSESLKDSVFRSYKKAIQSKMPVKIIDVVPAIENDLYLESTYTAIFDDSGTCTHILFVSNDVTLMKKTEQELRATIAKQEVELHKLRLEAD